MSLNLARRSNNNVLEVLRKTPYGVLLRIRWLDAATVKNADISKLPLANYYIETRRTTIGSYASLQQGQAQKSWHVVLEMDNTEGGGSTIRSIPLCLIYKVIPSTTKLAETTEKKHSLVKRELNLVPLEDGSVKIYD
jgi:hypothetical protein